MRAALDVRDAEVGDLRQVAGEQHVARLDITVHDAAGVRGGEAPGDVVGDRQHLVDAQRAVCDAVLERRPIDEGHRQVSPALLLARLVDGAHARVVERGGRLRLAEETRPGLRLRGQGGPEELQRDEPLQPHVLRLVDDAHPAAAERPDDAVPAGEEPGGIERRRDVIELLAAARTLYGSAVFLRRGEASQGVGLEPTAVLEEALDAGFLCEQALHLAAQRGVAGALTMQERVTVREIARERRQVHPLESPENARPSSY